MSKPQEVITVKSLLRREDYQNRFKEILGARAAQFSASVVNVSRDERIAECDPASVIAAAIVAATLDLPVDKNLGFAWIVPYKRVATFQMGYKGYVQLALRSGQYARMNARRINADAFGGFDDVGEPRILWDKVDERQPIVGYAFAWKLVGGFAKTCYWPRERVEAHAKQYSQSYRGDFQSPWKTHFDQMALKTVIRNELSDWGILSIDMQRAMKHDQGAQVDIESEVVYVDNEPVIPTEPKAKEADVSDLGPATKKSSKPAKQAAAAPPAGAGEPQPEKPVETPAQAPAAKPEATCVHCGEPMTAEHTCPGLQAAIAKAQERTGTPAEQAASEAKERRELFASIGAALEPNQIQPSQFESWTEAAKIVRKGQKFTDISTAKLRAVAKAIQNAETIAEIKKAKA